ncbi:hypothetical protein O6H91_01G070000 [Diphasiastrum complanatum]|nr:hypothetical protein O6H91_01G070000 [Diphasiastrum complanatum]
MIRMAWKDRPVVLMVSFLFLTSPLLPLVLYFFPLIMSTALCTIALVSIVPHETESELVEQIVGEIHSSDSSDEATASHLRSYATWLQWLMGMDRSDQISSDIPSTSSCQEPYYLTATTDAPTEQFLEACGASHDEESVTETILTTAIESEISYSVEDLFDPSEEECSIQESKFCDALRTQLAFDFIPDLQKITTQVQNLIKGSSKWLSMLTVDPAVRWFRETLREEKLHRDMYGPLLISERITVHLREDSEQQIFSLAEDYNKRITLAKEPAGVESCTFLSQIRQLDSYFDSVIGLRDSCSSNESSIWMEDDSSCSCEETASDCSDCDLDTFSLTDLDLISTVRSSIHDAQSKKEEQSASNQIIEPKSIISEFISKEGFSPDATEIIASREHEPSCDEQLTVDQKKIVADISQTDTNMCVRKSSLDSFSSCGQSQTDTKVDSRERGNAHQKRFAPMLNASVPKSMTVQEDCPLIPVQTVIEESSSPKDKLALHQYKNLVSSLEKCRKPVNSWPTVQKVLASRTKESFPSVMRTGNPLSSGSSLSTSGSLRAIKIKL